MLFEEMTSKEVSEKINSQSVAIFPIGAVEEHGPHLPLSTDCLQPEHVANEVAKKLGNTYVLLLDQSASWSMMPTNQMMMAAFSGAYSFSTQDAFDPDIGAFPPSLEMTDYVQPLFSLVIWTAVIAGSIALSGVAMRRKEVY